MRRIDNTGEKTGTGKIFSTGTNIKPHEQFMDKKIHKDAGTDNTDQRRLTRKAFEKSFSRLIHINKRSAMTVGLAIVVVFAMTASLIMPAVTLSKQAALKQGGITLESSDLRTAGTLDTTSLSTSSAESKLSKDPLSSGNKDSALLKSSNGKNSSKGGETSSEPSGRSSSGDSSSGYSSDQSNKSSDPSGKSTDPSDSASDQNTDSGKSDSQGDSSADKSDKSDKTNASGTDRANKSDADKANASDADKAGTENANAADAKDTDKEAADKENDPSEDTKDGLIKEKTELTFAGGDFDVVATVDPDAKLPTGTELKVKEIIRNDKRSDQDPQNKKYDKYRDDSLEAIEKDLAETLKAEGKYKESKQVQQQVEFSRFFDITFISDGKEVEPESDVNIRITYDKAVNIDKAENIHIVHFGKDEKTGEEEPEVLDKESTDLSAEKLTGKKAKDAKKNAKGNTPVAKYEMTDTSFDSSSFSVYGIVYTVDFHYEINGEVYDFSMDGGSKVKLSILAAALGMIDSDQFEDADDFIEHVANVEFSDESLVKVTRKNSDWILESLKPFITEETLTITMTNGDQVTVKVTDAQEVSDASTVDVNKTYIICYEDNNGYHVLKTDGTVQTFASSQTFIQNNGGMDKLGDEYQWSFYYVFTEKDRETSLDYTYYFIRPVAEKTKTIALNDAGNDLIQTGTNNVAVIPQEGGGFMFLGYNHSEGTHIELGYRKEGSNEWFESFNRDYNTSEANLIHIYEQHPLDSYDFTVVSDDYVMGSVSTTGEDKTKTAKVEVQQDGRWVVEDGTVHYYVATTNENKKNNDTITATPGRHRNSQNQNKWAFDYWDLDGVKLEGVGATIQPGQIDIPKNGSVLTAHFKQNPPNAYTVPDNEKEGTGIESMAEWLQELKNRNIPLNADGTQKTAEVYDYENRIYRVDLTAQSSLTTFDGIIDLGFMLDVSGSMNFPSLLYDSDDVANHSAKRISQINSNNNARNWGLSTNKTYYIITDAQGTATVCYLYYWQNQWWLCDASKNRFDNSNGRFDPGTGWSVNGNQNYGASYYSTSASYVIMEAGDRVTQADFADAETAELLGKLGLRAGDPKTRSFYLEQSLNGTLKELNKILSVLSIASDQTKDPDVKIAWNTFRNFLPNDIGQIQHNFISSSEETVQLNYDFNTYGGGTSTDAALLDAAGVDRNDIRNRYSDDDRKNWDTNNNVNHTYTPNYRSGFQWEANAKKYAVLITDGAPQRGGNSITTRYVTEAAQQLKNRDVDLITVGLGIDDVPSGKILMYDIADSLNNEKMFFSAKSGDELQDVLFQIIKQIMVDAAVQGEVTDVIEEAFYPVDKATGKPLEAGNKIDLDGNLTTDTSKPYGTITYERVNVGTEAEPVMEYRYGVKWENQDLTWEGWHGSVYIKAKEDLLGGNAVKTNEGDAVVEAKAYRTGDNAPYIPLVDKKYINNDPAQGEDPKYNRFAKRESPLVNINELSFLGNETEWTVYLGTEVDPKKQLRGLYDNILVEEVIKDGKGEDKNGDGLPDTVRYSGGDTDNNWYPIAENSIDDSREDQGRGDRNTFYLKDLIKVIARNSADGTYPWWDYSRGDLDWDKFLELALTETQKKDKNGDPVVDEEGNPVMEVTGFRIPYQVYGINDNSYIQITLEKEIVDGEEADILTKSPHATAVVGDQVEKYTLSALYSPDYDVLPKGQGGSSTADFHVGTYGTLYQGHAAGTETSENIHIINVYTQTLDVLKTDDSGNALQGAEFKLYKADAENGSDVDGLSGKYTEVASGTSDVGGIAHLEFAENEYMLPGTTYYLIETSAPAGYKKDDTVWTVELQTDKGGEYTDLKGDTIHFRNYPFNWEQGSRVVVDGQPVKAIVKGQEEGTTSEITNGSFISHKQVVSFRHEVENLVDQISFNVNKTWEHVSGADQPDTVTFELYRVSEKGHTYGPAEVEPCTCDEDGVKVYTCTECGHEERYVINKTEHIPGASHKENEVEATCDHEGGYDTVTRCRVCDAIISIEHTATPMLEHAAGQPKEENRVEPTCLAAGSYDTVTRCTRCNEILSSEHHTIAALGHDWGEWTVTTPAQPGVEGEETRVCKRDPSHTETRPIEALSQDHTVTIYFRCTGNGDGQTYYPGHITNIATRSGTGAGDMTIQWNWDQWTSPKTFTVDGLGSSTYSTSSSSNNNGARQTLTISNITTNLTIYVTISNGGYRGTSDNLIGQPTFAGTGSRSTQSVQSTRRMLSAIKIAGSMLPSAAQLRAGNDRSSPAMTSEELDAYLNSLKLKDETSCEEAEGAGHTYKELVDTYTIEKSNGWTLNVEDLPKYDEYGNEYSYYVKEVPLEAGEGFSFVTTYLGQNDGLHDEGSATINNEKLGSLSITKAINTGGPAGPHNDFPPSGTYSYPVLVTTIIDGTTYYVQDTDGTLGTAAPETPLAVTAGSQAGVAGAALTINNLPYGTYTVSEIQPDSVVVPGYSFVAQETGPQGEIHFQSVTSGDGEVGDTPDQVDLLNYYMRDASWTPEVDKWLNGTPHSGDAEGYEGYTFVLTEPEGQGTIHHRPAPGQEPAQDGTDTAVTGADGKAVFNKIDYPPHLIEGNTSREFYYTITEERPGAAQDPPYIADDIKYDTKTIYVVVTVVKDGATREATAVYYRDAQHAQQINAVDFDNTEMASLEVTKTVSGDYTPTSDDSFPITIKKGELFLNENGELVETDPELTIKDGQTLTFSAVPVGTYVVTEGDASRPGYSLTTTYTSQVGDADPQTSQSVILAKGDEGSVGITNDYTSNPVNIAIIKIDETTRDDPAPTTLPDAKFGLYKYTVPEGSQDGSYTVYPDADTYEKTTGADGSLQFADLSNGQYKIVETDPPKGYVAEQAVEIYFTVSNGEVIWTDSSGTEITEQDLVTYEPAGDPASGASGDSTFTVGNTPGTPLPNSGGPGTTWLYLLGSILLVGSSIALAARRRVRVSR